jgi:hypothetical protein
VTKVLVGRGEDSDEDSLVVGVGGSRIVRIDDKISPISVEVGGGVSEIVVDVMVLSDVVVGSGMMGSRMELRMPPSPRSSDVVVGVGSVLVPIAVVIPTMMPVSDVVSWVVLG